MIHRTNSQRRANDSTAATSREKAGRYPQFGVAVVAVIRCELVYYPTAPLTRICSPAFATAAGNHPGSVNLSQSSLLLPLLELRDDDARSDLPGLESTQCSFFKACLGCIAPEQPQHQLVQLYRCLPASSVVRCGAYLEEP